MRVYQVKNRRLQLQHEQVSHLQITMEAHFDEPAPEPLHVQKETFDQNARNCLQVCKSGSRKSCGAACHCDIFNLSVPVCFSG